MYETALVLGIVVLTLASAWSIYRSIIAMQNNSWDQCIAFLIAFLILIYFDYGLFLQLPI